MRLLNNSDSVIFTKGCLPGSLDLSQDLLSFSPPDVALGFEVMPGEVLHDGIDQLAHAAEAAGQDRLLALCTTPFLEQSTLRLALSAPSLAASFGRVSIAEVALFSGTQHKLSTCLDIENIQAFSCTMSLLFKRHYTSTRKRSYN